MLREAMTTRLPSKNLAGNPGFDQEKPVNSTGADGAAPDWQSGAVPGFAEWQDEASKGTFTWDRSVNAGKMQGVENGCFIQKYRARSGETFLLEVEGRGAGDRLLTVRWQTADGKWVAWDQDVPIGFVRQASGIETAHGLVTVPEGAGQMVLLLFAAHQKPSDACWFDNLGVYRLQDLLK